MFFSEQLQSVNIFVWLAIFLIVVVTEGIRIFVFLRESSQVSQGLLKRQQELNYLNFLSSASLLENKSIAESFPIFLNTLKETVEWTYHSIFRLDDTNQILPIRFTGYLPDWYMKEFSTDVHVKVGDISIGRAVATKQPVTINEAKVDPRFMDVTSLIKQIEFRSLTCCPIIGRLKTLGGFCTYSQYKNIFTNHDTQFLLTVANLYAIILEQKLLKSYFETSKKSLA